MSAFCTQMMRWFAERSSGGGASKAEKRGDKRHKNNKKPKDEPSNFLPVLFNNHKIRFHVIYQLYFVLTKGTAWPGELFDNLPDRKLPLLSDFIHVW